MKKNKRKKISILNILFLALILTLITSLVFKNRENFKNIFTKKNKIKASKVSTAADLNIGDIVYYNHKDVIKLRSTDPNQQERYDKMQKEHESNQKVTIPLGDSKTPGSGDPNKGEQIFEAKNYNTAWRVWDKLSDGRVMLISNRPLTYIYTKGIVGNIWWEHNAHKVAGIFGYGEKADVGKRKIGIEMEENIGATKGFTYKVGSGIHSAPDMMNSEDNGVWTIGGIYPKDESNKIKISGSRALTLADVEEKLGITQSKIVTGFGNIKTDSGWNTAYGTTSATTMRLCTSKRHR